MFPDPSRFPDARPRRLRAHPWLRALVAETRLDPADLILPIFVQEGPEGKTPIRSLPGVHRHNIAAAVDLAGEARALGLKAVALFHVTKETAKNAMGEEALNPDNLVCRTVRALKAAHPDLGVICDVALDPYTDHGHDGLIVDGRIDNDATLAVLARQAVVQAAAGCDILAPSDMMDGRVGAIRTALDEAGFPDRAILSYAVKYASAFYGPFREAVGSAAALAGGPVPSDKRSYQMDPANAREALREVSLDIVEGADLLMIKPGLPYLDIITKVKQAVNLPVFAYQVSGEHAMIAFAAEAGALDYRACMMESLTSLKRAGADAILTYAALDAARWLKEAG